MADIFDQATAFEEHDRETALKLRDRGPTILGTGLCLCCDAPMPGDRRWCDADCRDTYLAHQRRN